MRLFKLSPDSPRWAFGERLIPRGVPMLSTADHAAPSRARPRVLTLIPAYNPNADNLAATLGSMLAQTTPVDIGLIDDGSTPPIQVPHFAEDRVQLLRLPQNGGITVALRAGVQFAYENGYEFICRLDVGDLSYPRRVEKQLQFLDENPQVSLVGALARITDASGRTLFHHGIRGGPAAVAAYLWMNAPFRHSTFFMRTRALIEHGSYKVAFDGAEDYELLLRLAANGPLDCLAETLVDYVEDPHGLTESRRARQLRKRLAAQLTHLAPLKPASYAGVLRTLIIMATPRAVAREATLRIWRRRTERAPWTEIPPRRLNA